MNRCITKDHIQMANKQAHTLLVIRKIQIKTPAYPPEGQNRKD